MKKISKGLKKIFSLPPLPTVLICVPSFFLVIYVLANQTEGALAYIAYLASCYAPAALTTPGY